MQEKEKKAAGLTRPKDAWEEEVSLQGFMMGDRCTARIQQQAGLPTGKMAVEDGKQVGQSLGAYPPTRVP